MEGFYILDLYGGLVGTPQDGLKLRFMVAGTVAWGLDALFLRGPRFAAEIIRG